MGYDKKDPLSQLAEAYLVRGGKRLGASIVPVAEAKRRKNQNDEDHRQFEGEKLLAASERCCRIAMDAQGQMLDSEAFAKLLSERYNPRTKRRIFDRRGHGAFGRREKSIGCCFIAVAHDVAPPAGALFFGGAALPSV